MQHYWVKQEFQHVPCGTKGNIVEVYFSAVGKIKVELYCYMCACVYHFEGTFEEVIVLCNDFDREHQERKEFDLEHWEPTSEGN